MLRHEAIEAMARSGYPADAWDHVDEMQRVIWLSEAGVTLDALLVYLTDNAAEWSAPTVGVNPSVAAVGYLLAALREETG